jgi:hypothetical protein
MIGGSSSGAVERLRPAPGLGLALALLASACGGSPSALPDDGPLILLSKSSVTFEMDAYAADSVTPASDELLVANGGGRAPQGVPTARALFPSAGIFLEFDVSTTATGGFRYAMRPMGLAGYAQDRHDNIPTAWLDAGTYEATLTISWTGAINSPVIVPIRLTVRPHPQAWQTGLPTQAAQRFSHTTTALPDGGAVAIGGVFAERTLERLDPITHAWTWAAAALHEGRATHTATLLADGRVFVAGGQSQEGSTPAGTWEIWDPQEDRITATGALLTSRRGHAAVRLLDGRVLLVGGWREDASGATVPTRTCELFTPEDGSIVEVGPLHGDSPLWIPAALLEDGSGRVIALDRTPEGMAIGAELFDPATLAWTVLPSRPQPRDWGCLAALEDGRVVVFGGDDPEASIPLTSTELFDPATGRWTSAGPLYAPHSLCHDISARLPGGKVLVAGGLIDVVSTEQSMRNTAIVETFDPVTTTWSVAGALGKARAFHTVTAVADGTIFAVAGLLEGDPRPDTWREPAP